MVEMRVFRSEWSESNDAQSSHVIYFTPHLALENGVHYKQDSDAVNYFCLLLQPLIVVNELLVILCKAGDKVQNFIVDVFEHL